MPLGDYIIKHLFWRVRGLLDRAFLARQPVFQPSHARADHLLNLEEGHWFSDFAAVFVDHAEDLARQLALGEALFCLLLQLPVEEPLVNLNPRQARDLHGPLALLAIQLAAGLRKDAVQIRDLVVVLAVAVKGASVARAPAVHFAQALARDHWQLFASQLAPMTVTFLVCGGIEILGGALQNC